jgi:hypothetical protein
MLKPDRPRRLGLRQTAAVDFRDDLSKNRSLSDERKILAVNELDGFCVQQPGQQKPHLREPQS